jgi:uncharacterized protein (UPF0261 family)
LVTTVLLIATLDTKGRELEFVSQRLSAQGIPSLVLDAGVLEDPPLVPSVDARAVAEAGGVPLATLRTQADRGAAIAVMARGAATITRRLFDEGRIHGVLGLGGSSGTTIATAAMRALPVGVPKLMVSTLASGQVAPYVDVSDVLMLPSIVDIAGLNRISRRILANAAAAMTGMLTQAPLDEADDAPLLAATMFGVTTPCVQRVRERMEAAGYEMLVFHATGTGGRAMEALIDAGFIAGVADVTTTEWADELVGGVLSAGPSRLDAAARAGIPQVVSVGALDMVNFGPRLTVPDRFTGRLLHVHNPSVTLMRTTAEECGRVGEAIAKKLNQASGPVSVLLPLRGVSALDADGQPFHDPDADAALFEALRTYLAPHVTVHALDLHINDTDFADAVADTLLTSLASRRSNALSRT